MRTTVFNVNELEVFLMSNVIATMPEIQKVLGTPVYKTALRKLKQLSYLSSYSHGGSYYTLERIVKFDQLGLWSHGDIFFSKHGTLVSTLKHFVSEAHSGHFASDLKQLVGVSVKETLLRLIANGQVSRVTVANRYLYCSVESSIQKQQLLSRNLMDSAESDFTDEAKAAIIIFVSILDEKQKRLYAGVEALKYGMGGDKWISELLNMHPQTVARGRRELLANDVDVDRTRMEGGGRKPVEKKHQRSSQKSKS